MAGPNTAKHRAVDLDWGAVTRMLFMLAPTSGYLRHASLRSTLDYIHPLNEADRLALDFVRDVLTGMPTGEILDRWYGGRMEGTRLCAVVMDGVIEQLAATSAPAGNDEA